MMTGASPQNFTPYYTLFINMVVESMYILVHWIIVRYQTSHMVIRFYLSSPAFVYGWV